MGARLFACESVLQRMERDGFHCCWRWRRKPRAPSTLTLEKPTEPHSTHQSPPPPPTRRAHLQPQLPSFPRCLPTLARKVFPGPLRLGPRGTGKRGAGPIAGGACYVMARRSPDWTAPRRRHLESQSPFLATTKSASRAWMRCSNGPTSSPPNPKAASPKGGRCQVPSTSPMPPSVVASHRGRHPALHRGRSQHGYLATGRPPRRALSVSTAERRGLSQFMQYLPQIPPAISPSSPPLPSSSRGAVQCARALVRNPPFFSLSNKSSISTSRLRSADPTDRPGPVFLHGSTALPPLFPAPTADSTPSRRQTDRLLRLFTHRGTPLSLSLAATGRTTDRTTYRRPHPLHACAVSLQTRLRHDGRSKNTSLGPKVAASQLGQPPFPPPGSGYLQNVPPSPNPISARNPPAAISTDLSNRIRILAHIYSRTPRLNSTERPPSSVPGISCLCFLPGLTDTCLLSLTPRTPAALAALSPTWASSDHLSLTPASALASDHPNLHIYAEPPQKTITASTKHPPHARTPW